MIKLDVERAKSMNMTVSYEEFIRSHPKNEYIGEAQKRWTNSIKRGSSISDMYNMIA